MPEADTTPAAVWSRVLQSLLNVVTTPNLRTARDLERALLDGGYQRVVFGRTNQRASIEANAESDRGAAERLANAFDALLKAARLALDLKSERHLNPRNAAQRFLCPNPNRSDWDPQDKRFEDLRPPMIEFWEEDLREKQRYRKFQPEDGLATFLIRDSGTGVSRGEMGSTILGLNTDAKLQEWEAIGQYGHGGSSSLFFCESALVMTQPRLGASTDEVYWTLVYPEKDQADSKQELIRMWFAEADRSPLVVRLSDLPAEIQPAFPGTSIWHFGFQRGGWIKRITGPEQTNPWGRLGRLFFSYPLPFEIHGALARGDDGKYRRRITSPYHRLVEATEKKKVDYFVPEKREQLLVEGTAYGDFSFVAFVLPNSKEVGNYVDRKHPVILTLNGQNHGEMTRTVLENANLPELSASMIVEVRLDGLEQEALGYIITNSREMPKNSRFTRALEQRLIELLRADETLQQTERERQENKAKDANKELNSALSRFIQEILSDAAGRAAPQKGGDAPGSAGGESDTPPAAVPPSDPPRVLSFISEKALNVPEATTRLAKFKTDARPPKYSFGGDNPRIFATWIPTSDLGARVTVVGHSEVNERGYGSVSLHCAEDQSSRITDVTSVGKLELKLQSTDGSVLTTHLDVCVAPKPERREKARAQEIEVSVVFSAPTGDPDGFLAGLFAEPSVGEFRTALNKFKDALPHIPVEDCSYWGERHDREGKSILAVEVNAANPRLRKLLSDSRTVEERVSAKERYCQDVVLDCYQHCFKLDQVPDPVWSSIQNEEDEARKASEFYLNHDKAVRFAGRERERGRR